MCINTSHRFHYVTIFEHIFMSSAVIEFIKIYFTVSSLFLWFELYIFLSVELKCDLDIKNDDRILEWACRKNITWFYL